MRLRDIVVDREILIFVGVDAAWIAQDFEAGERTGLAPAQTVFYRRSRFATRLPVDRLYTPAHYWLIEEDAGL